MKNLLNINKTIAAELSEVADYITQLENESQGLKKTQKALLIEVEEQKKLIKALAEDASNFRLKYEMEEATNRTINKEIAELREIRQQLLDKLKKADMQNEELAMEWNELQRKYEKATSGK